MRKEILKHSSIKAGKPYANFLTINSGTLLSPNLLFILRTPATKDYLVPDETSTDEPTPFRSRWIDQDHACVDWLKIELDPFGFSKECKNFPIRMNHRL
jgi:hypothetical protein